MQQNAGALGQQHRQEAAAGALTSASNLQQQEALQASSSMLLLLHLQPCRGRCRELQTPPLQQLQAHQCQGHILQLSTLKNHQGLLCASGSPRVPQMPAQLADRTGQGQLPYWRQQQQQRLLEHQLAVHSIRTLLEDAATAAHTAHPTGKQLAAHTSLTLSKLQ
jgi:hypothetical protein